MTLPLRRKRPITAPNTRRATTIEPDSAGARHAEGACRRRLGWRALAVAASLAFGGPTFGGEAFGPSPAPSKLKWQVRRSPVVQRAIEPAEIADSPRFAARQVAADEPVPEPVRPLANKSARAKLRDLVMQVQSDKEDPFKDPFADEDRAKNADLQISPPTESPPARTETARPQQDEPAPLRNNADPFPEDRVPAPPSGDERTPAGPWPESPIAPSDVVSCEEQTDDCNRLVRDLRERDISKILVAVDIAGVEGQDFPCECKLRDIPFQGRSWSPTTFTWKATGVCHKPLYFEDVQLERYGHSWNPFVQPFMSAGHFFVSVPLLPYKMGLTLPNECIYTLGYYRPGSCAPYVIEPLQLSLRGALFEAAAVTGFVYWFWPPAD